MVIFDKNKYGLYQPKYIKIENGSYFYVSRPVKFIENSTSKYKTKFDFKLEGNNRTRVELLFNFNEKLSEPNFTDLLEKKLIPYKMENHLTHLTLVVFTKLIIQMTMMLILDRIIQVMLLYHYMLVIVIQAISLNTEQLTLDLNNYLIQVVLVQVSQTF